MKKPERYLRGVTKVLYMGDIFETLYVRVCVVYGGHRLRAELSSNKFFTRISVLQSMLKAEIWELFII